VEVASTLDTHDRARQHEQEHHRHELLLWAAGLTGMFADVTGGH
jgi:hypothetical protein